MKINTAANPAFNRRGAVFGAAAIACLAYCLTVFFILQKALAPGSGDLSGALQAASLALPPALLAAGLFHVYLLAKLLKSLTGRFINSLFVLLVIGSGILLVSDITLLSDIGKEYNRFDVSGQWAMLYAFTAFHLAVVIIGAALLQKRKALTADSGGSEAVYISVHHIALISGVLGVAGVFLAMSGAAVPLRYAAGFMVVLSVLALIPLVLILVYWRLRAKRKKERTMMDEKQFSDTAIAALLAALPVYILVCTLDLLSAFSLPASFFILLLFFIQLIVFSSVVLFKNR